MDKIKNCTKLNIGQILKKWTKLRLGKMNKIEKMNKLKLWTKFKIKKN